MNHFAAAAAENTDVIATLGIDWMMLILQGVAFLILVAVLAKFVYPVFMRIIDERQAKIDESVKAAEKAQKAAEKAEDHVAEELKTARAEAADIVATAKAEATAMIEKAQTDAKTRSERIVSEAHEDIEKQVIAARASLKQDTLELVKQAAGLATAHVADKQLDSALIQKSLEGARK